MIRRRMVLTLRTAGCEALELVLSAALKRGLLSVSLPLAFLAATPSIAGPTGAHDPAQRVRNSIQQQVAQSHFSGVILVARGNRILCNQAFGFANREWKQPNVINGKFRIGSLTKQFTAVAILQLQEAGKLSVDDPVSKYLTDAPASWRKVTIKHLLTHRSGIPSYTDIPGFFGSQARDSLSPEQIVDLVRDQPLRFEAGSHFEYDNTGYVLLGMIIERASGEKYHDYLRSHIFVPSAMRNTGYDVNADILPMRVSGYVLKNGRYANAEYIDMAVPFAAGALYSTTNDLATWVEALQGGKVIGKRSLTAMFTDWGDQYGFGVGVDKSFDRLRYAHSGGVNGFLSELEYYPSGRLTIVVLTNQMDAQPEVTAFNISAAFFNMPGQVKGSRPNAH